MFWDLYGFLCYIRVELIICIVFGYHRKAKMLPHLAALIVYISTSICTWPTRILSDIVIFNSFTKYHYVRLSACLIRIRMQRKLSEIAMRNYINVNTRQNYRLK